MGATQNQAASEKLGFLWRPANAPTNPRPGPRGPRYHCHQMGHVAAECPDRQPGGKLACREPGKPWCEHQCRVNSHSTAECRALNNDTTLSTIWPEQLSQEAIHGAHSHLSQDIRLITRRHIKRMEKPDLVVVGFPCQDFSIASDTPKGLRDPRTALFQEALRVIHLIWRTHGPCGYLFENLDASDHPVAEVRRKYCDVVQAVLGKGFGW
jgi:hypothetical protein